MWPAYAIGTVIRNEPRHDILPTLTMVVGRVLVSAVKETLWPRTVLS